MIANNNRYGETKRITIAVDATIENIKQRLQEDLGIDMSYVQVIQYLIKFYRKNSVAKPGTEWRGT